MSPNTDRAAQGRFRRLVLTSAATALVLGLAAPALAQTTASDEEAATTISELLVKAARQNERSGAGSKTDTPLIEIPQGVSIVTSDQLEFFKATSLVNALTYVPGLITQPESNARYAEQVTIRGFNGDSVTGNYLRDGMKLQAASYDGSQEPYGLERVEVLRGAASVLYGQVSPAGVINTVSKRPTRDWYREINLEAGNYGRYQASGDLSGPIDEAGDFAFRLTGLYRKSDTWTDYINDGKVYIAPAFSWRPSDDTNFTLLGFYNKTDTKFSAPIPVQVTLFKPAIGSIARSRFVGEPGYDEFTNESWTVGGIFDHRFNDVFSISQNVRYSHSLTTMDYLQVAYNAANPRVLSRGVVDRNDESSGFTSDTRVRFQFGGDVVRHDLLVGVDYYKRIYETYRRTGTVAGIDYLNPVYGARVNLTGLLGAGSVKNDGDQFGIYAQDQIKLFDKLVITAGVRKDWASRKDYSYTTRVITAVSDVSAVTGRIGAVYLFDNGLAPYASYAESFQPTVGGVDRFGNSFDPTTGQQVEAGLRFIPPGKPIVMTAAVYDLRQQNVLTPDPANILFSTQTGEVRSRGIELEAKVQLMDAINVIGSYTYTDTRNTKTNVASQLGKQVNSVPYNTAALAVDYRFDDLGLPGLRLGASARYIGPSNLIGAVNPATGREVNVPGYTLVDFYGAYEKDRWRVQINLKNAFDKGYFYCPAASSCRIGDPRLVVGSLSYRY